MGTKACIKRHLGFVTIVAQHFGKELIRPRWNGIKTLVLAKYLYCYCESLCPACTPSLLFYPSVIVGLISATVLRIETVRYSVKLYRMYQLYFALEDL